jgi:polysaccharide biosynthesis/export protein
MLSCLITALAAILSSTLIASDDDETPGQYPSVVYAFYRVEAPDVVHLEMRKHDGLPGEDPIRGDYLIAPDGTINLRTYGVVKVNGKKTTEIKKLVEQRLAKFLDSPNVLVSVRESKNRSFYVIQHYPGGESVTRVPFTGKRTVLDALKAVHVSLKTPGSVSVERVTPDHPYLGVGLFVDCAAIARGDARTNHELLPGDRLVIDPPPQTLGREYDRRKF